MKRVISEKEYNALSRDVRGIWMTERTDWPEWESIRHLYVGKRTMTANGGAAGTVLLIEGMGLTIVPNDSGAAA